MCSNNCSKLDPRKYFEKLKTNDRILWMKVSAEWIKVSAEQINSSDMTLSGWTAHCFVYCVLTIPHKIPLTWYLYGARIWSGRFGMDKKTFFLLFHLHLSHQKPDLIKCTNIFNVFYKELRLHDLIHVFKSTQFQLMTQCLRKSAKTPTQKCNNT